MKIRSPSWLKTEVRSKQGHALGKRKNASKNNSLKFVTELAPSPRQHLNRQGMQRISRLRKLEIDLEVGILSFCIKDTEVSN